MYFWTYRLQKTSLDKCLKSPVSGDSSRSNMVKGPLKGLLKSERQHLYHIYWSLRWQFRMKKNLSVICKILEVFVDPLTDDNKYSHLKETMNSNIFRGNYFKKKRFSQVFFAFCKFRFNFEHSQEKGNPHRWRIFELTDSEKGG